ncbi:MAG: DUF4190 domain-containing protein [Chloracidobacterium sp.]|nr:DUF4190 domain-containing protein [Chloracidobacterium sp.]MCC6824782.1 DUF4190 domain-containing protein [Acidobacteriota bacterium]MCO5334015.1 DUF4190 domain-containing protein [Pyrinomonadaceae bacterium]
MKQCPKCRRTYTDADLNFCLDDGELLLVQAVEPGTFRDDSPPTLMINDVRSTNPTGWPSQPTPGPISPAPWQGQQMQYPMQMAPTQTLPVVSLCLGIASVTVGWCCWSGVLLSPAAVITGIIALSQIKNDPQRYTGKGLAMAGLITGGAFIAVAILIFVLYGAAIFLGGIR